MGNRSTYAWNKIRRLRRRSVGLAALLAAAASIGGIASAQSPHRLHRQRPLGGEHAASNNVGDLRVFAYRKTTRKLARYISSGIVPSGATFAGRSAGQELYAWQSLSGPAGRTCIVAIPTADSGVGQAMCGSTAKAEESGVVGVIFNGTTPTVVALLPNNVNTVTFTTTDGISRAVNVTNNVVVGNEEPTLASISYTLPNGVSKTIPIERPATNTEKMANGEVKVR